MNRTFTINFGSFMFSDREARNFVKTLRSNCMRLNLKMSWNVLYWNIPIIRSCWVKVKFNVEGEESSVLALEEWKDNYKKNDKDLYYESYSGENLRSGSIERKSYV